MGFVFAVRRGCLELALEVGRFSERTRFKRSSKSIRARSHALRFIASDAGLEFSGGEDEVSLSHREGCAKFPEVSLQLLYPSEWRLVAYGVFFRVENETVLEARSILLSFRYESLSAGTRPESFLTIMRWYWRSAERTLKKSHCFHSCVVSLRLTSWQVLYFFRWIPSELNYSAKGSRFF